jgi:hypothetical protein
VIYINVEGLNAILRELEEEIGEQIPEFVAEHAFRFYSGMKSTYPGSYFEDLAFGRRPREGRGGPQRFQCTHRRRPGCRDMRR